MQAHPTSRRHFITQGAALGALSTLPLASQAQAAGEGRVTCHVLDSYAGRPGGGMRVDLSVQEGGSWKLLKSDVTVASGRTAEPLISGSALRTGAFMLEFFHADYFRRSAFLPQPAFFDRVVHFFSLPDLASKYHLTVVTAPWGYTTARWKE
jgi:5-hydroxyisourate hydrolase